MPVTATLQKIMQYLYRRDIFLPGFSSIHSPIPKWQNTYFSVPAVQFCIYTASLSHRFPDMHEKLLNVKGHGEALWSCPSDQNPSKPVLCPWQLTAGTHQIKRLGSVSMCYKLAHTRHTWFTSDVDATAVVSSRAETASGVIILEILYI